MEGDPKDGGEREGEREEEMGGDAYFLSLLHMPQELPEERGRLAAHDAPL